MSIHDDLAKMDVDEKRKKKAEKNKTKDRPPFRIKGFDWRLEREDAQKIKITGVSIPFFDLVWILVKLSFAAIPAAVIVVIIWSAVIRLII